MKNIVKKICAYTFVLCGLTTPVLAGSADFAGIYAAVHASFNGASISGTHSGGSTVDGNEVTQGNIGTFAPIGGWEAGFSLPLGDTFFVSAGTKRVQGAARLGDWRTTPSTSSDEEQVTEANRSESLTLTVSDPHEWYVQPSVSLFDNSAIFLKLGRVYADLTATGSVTGAPANLKGKTYAIGTTTIANNGLFIKTEAGASVYENMSIKGIGGNANAIVEGDPMVAYGSVSVGYKF
jgi:hypothetical protein